MLGALLAATGTLGARHLLRRDAHALSTALHDEEQRKRIANGARRRSMWRHRTKFLRYHAIYVVLVVAWMGFAAYARTPSAIGLSALLAVLFYAEVRLPIRLLNDTPSLRFRAPWFPPVSWALAQHVAWNYLLNALSTAALAASLSRTITSMGWLIVCGLPTVFLAHYYMTRGLLALLKWIATGATRILVFRRFSREPARGHRETTLPTVGAFGYTVVFEDETLQSTEAGVFWETQDLLGGAFYRMHGGTPAWSERIRFELHHADFAVFDLREAPTPSLELEYAMARELLPGDRIVFVVPSLPPDTLEKWFERRGVAEAVVIRADSRAAIASGLWRVVRSALRRPRWLPRAAA